MFVFKYVVEVMCGVCFNSVLFNCYCNGLDSFGWYVDNEFEFGDVLVIVFVSFGVMWMFDFCYCMIGVMYMYCFVYGSLFVMCGCM